MEEGKFLGAIVTGTGFKANPDKVQATARMPSPASLKQVQTLNGRLVALNRFLANHDAKSYPFISTLRKCLKKAQFRWTPEAKQAFQEVNKFLMELPTLTALHAGEPLTLYFSASEIAVEAVLLTDRKNIQTPIYYVSRTLSGPETRYSMLEKLVLAWFMPPDGSADISRVLIRQFSSLNVVHIKRSENKSADALSKLASTNFEHLAKDIRVEVLDHPSVPHNQVLVIQTGVESWMTPIKAYLSSGALPAGEAEGQKIKHKALNYQLTDGILYRRSFLGPLLRCVDVEDANYLIQEIHEGICGLHAGTKNDSCKDHERREWLKELQVTQVFTSVAHPQANGQVERTNRTIKEGIKARLGTKRTGWVDELPHVLWAFNNQKNSSNSETPFSLTYGTEPMIPIEIGIPTARVLLIDNNDHELRMNLDLLEERRELASIREHNYKP
ncbi:uncharacterized protein LOC143596881 [Bidens hawaiensis]|uniref:uncharacterized protein LOC143596881 n=1 Tax=Bidens hawaiensis TaxID=980011 RepID=UPI0040494D73